MFYSYDITYEKIKIETLWKEIFYVIYSDNKDKPETDIS